MKKLTLILPIVIASLLQGCVAGAFVAGGATGTSVARDKRSFDTMKVDQDIIFQGGKAIAANPDLHANAHIVLTSYNNVVLLAGQAPTAALRTQAVQLVANVPNVRRIFNEITLEKSTSAWQRSKDAIITANVKARMVATTNLEASRIKAVTEDNVVYLMGLTSRRQADIAAIVARNSSGVERVVKLIEYTDEPQ